MAEINEEENNELEGVPVLRREELILILESLFRFSRQNLNAFQRFEDGLYVKDLEPTLTEHIENDNIHPTKEQTDILKNFSLIDEYLCYKGNRISSSLSNDEGNELDLRPDGFYFKQRPDKTEELKEYSRNLITHYALYDYQIVPQLPQSTISDSTIYMIKTHIEDIDADYYIKWIHREGQWICLDLNLEDYAKFARKENVNNTIQELHTHDNLEILNLFTIDEETGKILIDGFDIIDVLQVSNDENNAIRIGSDGKLFVPNLRSELDSLETGSSSKTVLLQQQCNNSGEYELEGDINDYNFLIIEYYLLPDNEEDRPYDAKSDIVDVDNLNYLYENHIDYMLEHDYGFSTYNSKIRLWDRTLQVTYFNKVCIYRIVGVK